MLWGKFLSSSRSYLRKRIRIRRVVWGCTKLVLTFENGFVFVGRFEDVLSVLTKTDEWHMYRTVIALVLTKTDEWHMYRTVVALVLTKTDERYVPTPMHCDPARNYENGWAVLAPSEMGRPLCLCWETRGDWIRRCSYFGVEIASK